MTSTTQARPARLTTEQPQGLNPPQREAVLRGRPGACGGRRRFWQDPRADPPDLLSGEPAPGSPRSILAITFTNKAAAMRGRVMDLVGNRAKLMWVSTFHSACVRILRSEIGRFNIARTFSIYDDADSSG